MSACSQCRHPLAADARFCSQCGARVQRQAPQATAERRLLTVVFCDLVGSTQLSTRLDPEEIRELIQLYQTACAREVERYGGYVAQYLGDGILVYFGYPTARADAAERAVLAALGMRDAVARLSEEIRPTWGIDLAVRLGVHSGLVVVGEMGGGQRKERLALGEAPNVAARVQGQAAIGEVLISEATSRLAGGRFLLEDRGTPTLKGVTQPLRLYLAAGSRPHGVLGRARHGRGTHGRDNELAVLDRAWRAAKGGRGRHIEITGEAGVGKTHLVSTFVQRAGVAPVALICDEMHRQTPLWPFVDHLIRSLELERLPASGRRAVLAAELTHKGLSMEHLPGLAGLVGAAPAESPTDPAAARAATTQALAAYLLASPEIIICEDAQWADASTLELLVSLRPQLSESPVLLLVTGRNRIRWPDGVRTQQTVVLAPLDREAAAAVVHDCLGAELSQDQLDLLLRRADGMPIFLEELAAEMGAGTLPATGAPRNAAPAAPLTTGEFDVPTNLHGLLMNRLDQVGPAKRIAQEASVLNRTFTRDELEDITTVPVATLAHSLDELEQTGIIDRRLGPDGDVFQFRHALLRSIAYGAMLRQTRTHIHRRVAVSLQRRLGDQPPSREQLGLLAHHFRRSLPERGAAEGDITNAAEHLLRAGTASLALSAYKEAETEIQRARNLASQLPEAPARWRLETTIFNELSQIHRATIGFAAPEVVQDLKDARRACEKLGDDAQVATVSLALWSLLLGRGDYAVSLDVAREVLELSASIDDVEIRLRALAACGNSEFWLGALAEAFAHADQVLAEYDADREGAGLLQHGWDAGVHAYMVATWSAWLLGREDALEYEQRMHELAGRIAHPLTTAMAENTSCMLHILRRDSGATIAAAERLTAVAERYELSFYKMFATLFKTDGLARDGRAADLFPEADQTFRFYQANLGGLAQTFVGSFMAVVYATLGDRDQALAAVQHALAAANRCDERVFEPTLRRQLDALTGSEPPSMADLELCGDLTDNRRALSATDPRNVWIA